MELVTAYRPHVDELFKAESKKELVTNTDYDWTGAHSIKIWKMTTAPMNDYSRRVTAGDPEAPVSLSRYGALYDLDTATEEMLLKKDRSFIYNVDKMDQDETGGVLAGASTLSRQLREVVVPEVDTYTYGVMVANAGIIATPVTLGADTLYDEIIKGSQALDEQEVPDTERVLVVTPATYTLLKQADIFDSTDIGAEARLRGVVGVVDGMEVVKIPATRLPEKFGFMIAHPSATVAPVKLEDYTIHSDTVLSSGDIVTGRIVYDAFVLDNKKTGIYYQSLV